MGCIPRSVCVVSKRCRVKLDSCHKDEETMQRRCQHWLHFCCQRNYREGRLEWFVLPRFGNTNLHQCIAGCILYYSLEVHCWPKVNGRLIEELLFRIFLCMAGLFARSGT